VSSDRAAVGERARSTTRGRAGHRAVRPDEGRITLTPAGETLLPFARRILADVDAAAEELRSLGGLARGRIALGATPSLAATLVPAVLSRFHAAYPGIDLAIRQAGSVELVAAVEEGALDVALVILPVRHDVLETQALLREELVVAVARSHPLARRRTIGIADLRDVPLVMFREGYDLRSTTEAACRAAGFARRSRSKAVRWMECCVSPRRASARRSFRALSSSRTVAARDPHHEGRR
jgi:DNA-binding transcriptional LysR family regulator